jgi:O-acetylserine/cysteine efflux transporter
VSRSDRFLALLVAAIWGCNVVAIDIGLDHFPPLFFAALRFVVIAIPTVLLVRSPGAPWRWVIGYGLGFGVVQFAFLFVAMDVGMPAGLASLVLQSSAPFTVLLGVLLLREHVSRRQVAGLCIAMLGLALVAVTRLHGSAPVVPVLLTLAAGLGWAAGTVCSRLAEADDPFRFMLWMCVVPPIPLLAMSLIVEGPQAGWSSLTAVFAGEAWPGVGALLYIVVPTTLIGSGLWSTLLKRHPAGVVGVYSLAVPVAGILSSWLVLDEVPARVDQVASVIVVLGLLLGTPAVARRRAAAVVRELATKSA